LRNISRLKDKAWVARRAFHLRKCYSPNNVHSAPSPDGVGGLRWGGPFLPLSRQLKKLGNSRPVFRTDCNLDNRAMPLRAGGHALAYSIEVRNLSFLAD